MRINRLKIPIVIILSLLAGCTLLPREDVDLQNQLSLYLEKDDIEGALRFYKSLADHEQKGIGVSHQHQQLLKTITAIQSKTVARANRAVAAGQWHTAIDVYREQMPLIENNVVFAQAYRQFNQQLEQAKNKLNDSFLLTRGEYLLQELELDRKLSVIDPYDEKNNLRLQALEAESKLIAKKLLSQGRRAIRANNLALARKLIPVAKNLDDNKQARRASRVLEKMKKPHNESIQQLISQATFLYSNEQYLRALEIWNEILYLDPENKEVQAHKARTETVLDTLEKIKQEHVNDKDLSSAGNAG